MIAGIMYIIIGLFFYFSPITVMKLFAVNVSENWLDLVRDNELVAPIYYTLRALAALLITAGVANIMPLFEPERYRGLIYYNNLIFPALALVIFFRYTLGVVFASPQPGAEQVGLSAVMSGVSGHLVITVLMMIFLVIFILSLVGIYITRNEKR
jgi:hypothetical protein